jgi:hypothetical protein
MATKTTKKVATKTATKKATPKKSTKKIEEARLAPEATPYIAGVTTEPVIESETTFLDKIKKFFGL